MQQAVKVDAASVGARIRTLRQELGLSQRELAVEGVTYAYISRIESGSRIPSVQALVALADRLGVTAEYLINGLPPPPRCIYCGRPRRRTSASDEPVERERERDERAA